MKIAVLTRLKWDLSTGELNGAEKEAREGYCTIIGIMEQVGIVT